jgi:hypothetical protein
MEETLKVVIGIAVLILGIPIGNILAKKTREELRGGQRWFNLLVITSLAGGMIAAILGSDTLMFSFFFIAIVTSRSLRRHR